MRSSYLLLFLIFISQVIAVSVPVGADVQIDIYVEVVETSTGWEFKPDKLVMVEGHPVTIIYNNTDDVVHDFNVEFGDDGLIHFAVFPNATADVEGSYDITRGQYEFSCSISGHKEAGMVGTLYVAGDISEYQDLKSSIGEGETPELESEWQIFVPIAALVIGGIFVMGVVYFFRKNFK